MFYWISFIMRENEGTFYDTFFKTLISATTKNSSKYVWIQFSANGRCNLKVFFFFTTHITSILKVVKWSASKPNFQGKGSDNGIKVLGWGEERERKIKSVT